MRMGLVVLLLVWPTSTAAQALLTGQSNACALSPYLPPGSHVLVCQSGAPIAYWDVRVPGSMVAPLTQALTVVDPSVIVWWQGESDHGTASATYLAHIVDILTRLAVRTDGTLRPIMLIEIAAREDRAHITAVHRALAAHPRVAFIPTQDLPRDGTSDHFTPEAYATVAARLMACYRAACWQ
jgi:hypothetical protein